MDTEIKTLMFDTLTRFCAIMHILQIDCVCQFSTLQIILKFFIASGRICNWRFMSQHNTGVWRFALDINHANLQSSSPKHKNHAGRHFYTVFRYPVLNYIFFAGVVPKQTNKVEEEACSGNGFGKEKAGTSRRLGKFRY